MWACAVDTLRRPTLATHPSIRMFLEHPVHQAASVLGASSLLAPAAQPSPSCHRNTGPGMPRTPFCPPLAVPEPPCCPPSYLLLSARLR